MICGSFASRLCDPSKLMFGMVGGKFVCRIGSMGLFVAIAHASYVGHARQGSLRGWRDVVDVVVVRMEE